MKSKLYLDTSIASAYYDTRVPIRQLMTQKWFQYEINYYDIHISELVIEEINRTNDPMLRENLLTLLLDENPIILKSNEDTTKLANEYINKKIIPKKELNDAIHIAIVTLNNIPFLASWNFEHVVKATVIKKIDDYNIKHRYDIIEIGSLEIFGGAKYGNLSQ